MKRSGFILGTFSTVSALWPTIQHSFVYVSETMPFGPEIGWWITRNGELWKMVGR